MNSITQQHINHVINWLNAQKDCQPSITKDRFDSLIVFVEEFKKLKMENEVWKDLFIQSLEKEKNKP